MKMMKDKKMRVRTLLSQGEINCRMYASGKEAVNGFSKMYSLFSEILF
jgi:hypothetical protein